MANAVEIIKASEVAAEVKKQFGHTVSVNQIYMIKTKQSTKRRPKEVRKAGSPSASHKLSSAAMWWTQSTWPSSS
jgi:hypothetical protein